MSSPSRMPFCTPVPPLWPPVPTCCKNVSASLAQTTDRPTSKNRDSPRSVSATVSQRYLIGHGRPASSFLPHEKALCPPLICSLQETGQVDTENHTDDLLWKAAIKGFQWCFSESRRSGFRYAQRETAVGLRCKYKIPSLRPKPTNPWRDKTLVLV